MNKIETGLENRAGKLYAVQLPDGKCFLVLGDDTTHTPEVFPGMGSTEQVEIPESASAAMRGKAEDLCEELFESAWNEKKYTLPGGDTPERDAAKLFWDRGWTMSRRALPLNPGPKAWKPARPKKSLPADITT